MERALKPLTADCIALAWLRGRQHSYPPRGRLGLEWHACDTVHWEDGERGDVMAVLFRREDCARCQRQPGCNTFWGSHGCGKIEGHIWHDGEHHCPGCGPPPREAHVFHL